MKKIMKYAIILGVGMSVAAGAKVYLENKPIAHEIVKPVSSTVEEIVEKEVNFSLSNNYSAPKKVYNFNQPVKKSYDQIKLNDQMSIESKVRDDGKTLDVSVRYKF